MGYLTAMSGASEARLWRAESRGVDLGSAEGKQKTLRAKDRSEGSQKLVLEKTTSSLAVFYVEQVALNRHVRPMLRPEETMQGAFPIVKREIREWQAARLGGV